MIIKNTTAGFELANLGENDKLHRVLSSTLKSRLVDEAKRAPHLPSRIAPESHNCSCHADLGVPEAAAYRQDSGATEYPQDGGVTESSRHPGGITYWDAEYFGLENVKLFQESRPEEQREMLRLCSRGLLEEAYFVEKAGTGYMAKMVLLAESTEERMLYSLFSAEEATHLAWIRQFLPEEPVATEDGFLRFLSDLAESEDKALLLFAIQVVLEGWGLSHYRSISRSCRDRSLAEVLAAVLQDEARHHSTGVILFDRSNVSATSRDAIVETLSLFLGMVQAGPQRVVAAVDKVKGHLSYAQKVKLFKVLDTETHSSDRLATLRSLMLKSAIASPVPGKIVWELEERGAFQPFPASKCAALA